MKERRFRKKDMAPPLYTTYALADTDETDPLTNVGKPSEIGVKEAKAWVDHNKK